MTNTEQRIDAIFKRLQTEEFEPLREFLKSQLDAEFSSLKKIILFNLHIFLLFLKTWPLHIYYGFQFSVFNGVPECSKEWASLILVSSLGLFSFC